MNKWEYRVVREEKSETFQSVLNTLGSEGWEAVSGQYGIGESHKVTLGQGMPSSMAVGAPTWTALMKRGLAN